MEILQVTLPEVIKNFTKWDLLCNFPLEGPWKQSGVAVWGAGNCLLVATTFKGSTATELELSPYQGYPPDPDTSDAWNSLLARCVQAGWISNFEPIGHVDYDRRKTTNAFWASHIAAFDADPSGYESHWKKDCLEENYLDWEAEHKTRAEINQEIKSSWPRFFAEMAQFRSSITERTANTYKTAEEAAHSLLACLEAIDDEYVVELANRAYAQRPVTNATESKTTNARGLARESIIQWLREGNEHEAANLLAECSISIEYVDAAFAMVGDGEVDIYDAQIAAPRRIFEIVDNKSSPLAEQIDRAIREYAKSNNFHIQNVTWVSRFSDAKTTIHPKHGPRCANPTHQQRRQDRNRVYAAKRGGG